MATPAALLERYVEAKDLARPHLMRDIYAPDAVLTYSIATDAIDFPAEVRGVEGKDLLPELGRLVLWKGAQPMRIEAA